jgi:hypothetical protein
MTKVVCDGCETTLSVEGLHEVTQHPSTNEALCDDCASVRCHHCDRHLNVGELTQSHVHESSTDTFVCDTCPSVELPYEFEVCFRREYESNYPPTWMNEIYPDVSSNPSAIAHRFWKQQVYVTYRMTEDKDIELVGIE